MQITDMQIDLKKILCWLFACTALMYLLIPNLSVLSAIRRVNASHLGSLFVVTFAAIVPILCAVAWWTIWKKKPSARAWGIAASIVEILIFARSALLSVPAAWPHHLGALFIGIVGLVVFLRRD
jgi:uncharacterized membrane protein